MMEELFKFLLGTYRKKMKKLIVLVISKNSVRVDLD